MDTSEQSGATVAGECPDWCAGSHLPGNEHYSVPTRIGDLLAELVRYPGDGETYLSLLNHRDGTEYFLIPLPVVPLIATTALRLVAPAGVTESLDGAHLVPRRGAR
jgi:hypothetical protein